MKNRGMIALVAAAVAMVMSACAPTAASNTMTEKPAEAMMTEAMTEAGMTEGAMMDETATPEAMMDQTSTPGAKMEAPVWFGAALTDVNTGKTFTINDFKGKVVLVETMAQWCSTCKRQQNEVKTLHAQMTSTPDLVTIALDIDPNENADTLKTYAASNGFDWLYAVPSKDTAREIGNLYGAQFLNPPSAPMLIVDRKGEAHQLPFGVKSATDLMKALEPFLSASM